MRYDELQNKRDLRIDFLRGFVMFILVVVHIEIFSIYNFVAWERVGLISGAEGFVILSGYVLGQVHRRVLAKGTYMDSVNRLFDRSVQLYKVNVTVCAVIFVLCFIPFLDLTVIKTFKNWGSGDVYPLFPHVDEPWYKKVALFALLRNSPHQIQILGLYTVLLAITPIAMWMMRNKRVFTLLGISWILYFYNWSFPSRPTNAQFEYAFPLLAWQVIYFHGLAIGYFQKEISEFLKGPKKAIFNFICVVGAIGFIVLAWCSPNGAFPEWARFDLVSAGTYHELHWKYFDKGKLGLLRIVNYLCFLVAFYLLLTRFWTPINKALGWLFVPLGQASLYVFIMHLIMVVIAEYITGFSEIKPTYQDANLLLNTLVHTGAFVGLWVMVKTKFLYFIVPR